MRPSPIPAARPPAGEGFVQTRWWWVRHAPVREDGGRIYGQRDISCDCSDASVFRALARHLPSDAIWIASHLKRTHETAHAIWRAAGVEPAGLELVKDLAEQDLGDWQGLDRAAFFAARQIDPASYWFAPADERAPNGESFDDMARRVGEAVARLTTRFAGRDIVAVSHGGPIKAAIAAALGVAPRHGLAFGIDNCSTTRLEHLSGKSGSGWRVAVVNHQPWAADATGATKPA